jgi:hypothetical protein
MELVRGIKITDYCDQANLTTKERLDLFIKVCLLFKWSVNFDGVSEEIHRTQPIGDYKSEHQPAIGRSIALAARTGSKYSRRNTILPSAARRKTMEFCW